MPAGVRVDADVPQGCEIVTSLQHVHAPRPMGNDSPAALVTLARVCGANRPVRQVTLLGPARGRFKSVLVLLVWHSHVTLGEPPTPVPLWIGCASRTDVTLNLLGAEPYSASAESG
jgi:hypothetical protein